MAQDLDEIDRAILAEVQSDARATLDRIGEHVGLSAAAVQRRIRRLRDEGIISATHSVIDPAAVGMPILVIALVSLHSDGSGAEVELDDALREHPHVQQAYELAGSFDRAALITAPDMATYRSITRDLFDANTNVRRFASHVVMTTLKRSLSIPFDG
ncbi:MAG: Lrp/AsnC family transcriptional regulator [Acidimicrobiales bacterium]